MYRVFLTSCLLMLVALTAGTAAATDRTIDRTVAAEPDGTVRLEMLAGSVKFVAWDRAEVAVRGTVGEDVEEVEIDASGGLTSIEVELRNRMRNLRHGHADLEILVPSGSTVEAETLSADVEVRGTRGAVVVESVSGSVRVAGGPSELELATVSGRISVASAEPIASAECESVSGEIRFEAPLARRGRYSFEAVSGNVTLRLPEDTAAEFDVETFSGEIDNALGPPAERTSSYVPAQTLRFSLGGGGARVSVESFSGRVRLESL